MLQYTYHQLINRNLIRLVLASLPSSQYIIIYVLYMSSTRVEFSNSRRNYQHYEISMKNVFSMLQFYLLTCSEIVLKLFRNVILYTSGTKLMTPIV